MNTSAFGVSHTLQTKSDIKQMLENQSKFNKEINDINQGHPQILGMTSEMVMFYTAVALVEAKNCFLKEDPMGCALFSESLKDPAGHVGFMSFMISAHKSSEWMIYLSKGKLPKYMSRNIGLMVGMMVQETLVDFLKNPNTKELIGLAADPKYPTIEDKYQRAKILKNNLWKETYGNENWRADKGIAAVSLLAAVALTSGTQYLAKETLNRVIPRIGIELGKRIWIGSRFVRVATPVGLAITGTIIFLEWSGITEKYVSQPLREGYARTQLQFSANRLRLSLKENQNSPKELEELASSTSEKFAKFRTTILHEPLSIYYGHQKALSDVSQRFFTSTQYTTWLTEGMDKESYKNISGDWHQLALVDEIYYDRKRYIEGIFCGVDALDAIQLKVDIHGVPVPLLSIPLRNNGNVIDNFLRDRGTVYDFDFLPYRVTSETNTCVDSIYRINLKKYPNSSIPETDKVYCPVNVSGGRWQVGNFWYTNFWGCKFVLSQYREHLLYKTQSSDLAFADRLVEGNLTAMTTLLSKTQSLKLGMIKRYERNVRESLLSGLSGKNVIIPNETSEAIWGKYNSHIKALDRNLPKGAIPLLDEEISFWNRQIENNKTQTVQNILKKYLTIAIKQKESAVELITFMQKSFSERDRSQDIDQLFTQEDWATLAKFYKQFILN